MGKRNFEAFMSNSNKENKKLIVVLEKASLRLAHGGQSYGILNAREHSNLMKKGKLNAADFRPDIIHHCLLTLQRSALNHAGLLKVFIHTDDNVLIALNQKCQIPDDFSAFSRLMGYLLTNQAVRSVEQKTKLIRLIKNPVDQYLPVGCKKICMSYAAEKLAFPDDLVPKNDEPLVIVVGAMAHGKVDVDFVSDNIAISKCHMSASGVCSEMSIACAKAWDVY